MKTSLCLSGNFSTTTTPEKRKVNSNCSGVYENEEKKRRKGVIELVKKG